MNVSKIERGKQCIEDRLRAGQHGVRVTRAGHAVTLRSGAVDCTEFAVEADAKYNALFA